MQETDEMFKLHALTVDALSKVRRVMNKVIIAKSEVEDILPKMPRLIFRVWLINYIGRDLPPRMAPSQEKSTSPRILCQIF